MNVPERKRSGVPTWAAFALKVPSLNEKLLGLLFQRPHGQLRPEERILPQASARQLSFQGKSEIVVNIYGHGRRILLVHGWGAEGVHLAGFVDPLVKRGFQVVSVDLPAHGKSGGKLTNAVDCADALILVERRVGSFDAVIAHSWGCPVVVVAQQRGLMVSAATFIAPLPSLEAGIEEFSQRSDLDKELLDKASRRLEKKIRVDRALMNLKVVGAKLGTPLLIIHDQEDHRTPIQESRVLSETWPDARLVETQGLGHRRILRDPTVIEKAVAFVDQEKNIRETELDSIFPPPDSQSLKTQAD
jgi:pimeloyl-ACP methyl ester carboxylesterase